MVPGRAGGKSECIPPGRGKVGRRSGTPNLDKILQLSELFGVTTDYLLKDELEEEEFLNELEPSGLKRVTLAEANAFLRWRESASVRIAVAAFLCIFSVIPLLLLGVMADHGLFETIAGVVGLGTLLITAFTEHEVLLVGMLSVLLLQLPMEGNFSKQEKQKSKRKEQVGTIYWLAATAVYLGWSFLADSWKISWSFGRSPASCSLL